MRLSEPHNVHKWVIRVFVLGSRCKICVHEIDFQKLDRQVIKIQMHTPGKAMLNGCCSRFLVFVNTINLHFFIIYMTSFVLYPKKKYADIIFSSRWIFQKLFQNCSSCFFIPLKKKKIIIKTFFIKR